MNGYISGMELLSLLSEYAGELKAVRKGGFIERAVDGRALRTLSLSYGGRSPQEDVGVGITLTRWGMPRKRTLPDTIYNLSVVGLLGQEVTNGTIDRLAEEPVDGLPLTSLHMACNIIAEGTTAKGIYELLDNTPPETAKELAEILQQPSQGRINGHRTYEAIDPNARIRKRMGRF